VRALTLMVLDGVACPRTKSDIERSLWWKKDRLPECIQRGDAHPSLAHFLTHSLTRSLVPFSSFPPSVCLYVCCPSSSDVESAWINNAYPRARTVEKSTAVAARGASPRTPAIAHTYLYTVIFKMKERRAGGRVVVVVLVGVVECTLTGSRQRRR